MPLSTEYKVVRRAVIITLSFTAGLWLILIVEKIGGFDLNRLGILPRTLYGLIGIITSPLIHEGVFHLLANTLPLIILGIGLFYFYYKIAAEVVFWLYLSTGFWVWVIGRNAFHIGASGIIYGLMAFIIVSGLIRRNVRSLAISMAVFVLYGGMIYGVFPVEPHVSWESHLMGLLSGIILAFFFRKQPIYVGDDLDEGSEDEPENENNIPYFTNGDNSSDKDVNITYEFKPSAKDQARD